MNNNDQNISDPIGSMKKSGKLIPPMGDLKKENLNPLGSFSCREVLKYLPDFCEGKLGGNKLVIMKIEKHLKKSVSGKCVCAKKFLELNQSS